MAEANQLPSPVLQLARAVAHSPKDGVERYRTLQAGLPESLRSAPGYEEAVNAITELGGHHDNVADLASDALERWFKEESPSRKRGYAALLGAVSEELAAKAFQGSLDEQERRARSQIREQFFRASA